MNNAQSNFLLLEYMQWCEARPECNRERLTDILVRPLQRMTKYSLLLGAILKVTTHSILNLNVNYNTLGITSN